MKVKEIFYSIQGEGFWSGMPAVFVRLSGCNLWTGHERHRATAICRFCDTDFLGGVDMPEHEIIDMARGLSYPGALIIFTGGEPLLQLTESILELASRIFRYVCIETNGTVELPMKKKPEWLWVTVSPKAGSELRIKSGNELKVVWPQPFDLDELEKLDFRHFYLQPMHGKRDAKRKTIDMVKRRAAWRLSVQAHKYLSIR